jgi:low temperature requirement protein LtrA
VSEGFRTWWLPPRRAGEPIEDRAVSFLELFFDLVFVVLIARLSRQLSDNAGRQEIARTGLLLVPVWSAWINGTFYHDLHGTNDISIRVFTFAQMVTIAGMAVYVGSATGAGAPGFAISYALNHLVLVVMWYRTGHHDPAHRPASIPFTLGYLISVALFVASVAVAPPVRFVLWGVALLVEIAMLTSVGWLIPDPAGLRTRGLSPAVVERFGLLVMIVLGGVVIGAIDGVNANRHIDAEVLVTGFEAVVVACGLWWVYFDFVARLRPIPARSAIWAHLHFFVVAGLAGVGAAILSTVGHADMNFPPRVHWLLAGSLSVTFLAIAGLIAVLEIRHVFPQAYGRGMWILVTMAGVSLATGPLPIGQSRSLAIAWALLAVPIGYGISTWVKLKQRGLWPEDPTVL